MLRKLKIIVFLFLISHVSLWATHIVGGEFELIHIEGFRYKLRLIQYFDVVFGNPAAEDQAIVVSIFRNSDNILMSTVILTLIERVLVEYTTPSCAIGQLVTRKLVYESEILLEPSTVINGVSQNDGYDDPEGYHVVMERCCRNNVISNAFQPFPNSVGQTWTLDFPPVIKDGQRFINSSPVLFPPLSDYACVDQLYFFDFAGTDLDGDSITYTLVTPYNSSAIIALPTAQPKPHNDIIWNSGIDIDNVIPGNPSLNTTIDGFLTVNPSRPGLFVFALLAEEFRDGEKIGEVRRDFQMLVINCPGPNFPPIISAKKKDTDIFYTENNIMQFSYQEEKCFEFFVTDLNSFDPENIENLTFEVIPINFNADISQILPLDSGFLDNVTDTLKFEVCFPDCPYIDDQPFLIEFRVKDETCPLPLEDTLRIAIEIELPPNQDPFYVDENQNPLLSLQIIDTLREGEIFEMIIFGVDPDGDTLELTIVPEGFELKDFGMITTDSISEPGRVISKFFWDTGCGVNNYGLFSDFSINVVLNDLNLCDQGDPDTLNIDIHVFLPTNNDPIVSSDLTTLPDQNNQINLELGVFDQIDFTVFTDDIDQDYVFLKASPGGDFTLDDLGMQFQDAEGQPQISSQFSWDLNCTYFDPDIAEYPVYFVATDLDTCKIPNADTLTINFRLFPPENLSPELSIVNLAIPDLIVRPGELIDLDLIGLDVDNDIIDLDLIDFNESISRDDFTFQAVTGTGNVSSNFRWQTSCSLVGENSSSTYDFNFLLVDDYCVEPNGDTLSLRITVDNTIPQFDDIIAPNVFTPNGDEWNNEFTIPGLPSSTCDVQFLGIKIFNRWGKEVFNSTDPNFGWTGKDMPVGVYYYFAEYSNSLEYKGTVSLLR